MCTSMSVKFMVVKNNKVGKIMLALVFYMLYVMSLVISLWIDRFSSYKINSLRCVLWNMSSG